MNLGGGLRGPDLSGSFLNCRNKVILSFEKNCKKKKCNVLTFYCSILSPSSSSLSFVFLHSTYSASSNNNTSLFKESAMTLEQTEYVTCLKFISIKKDIQYCT